MLIRAILPQWAVDKNPSLRRVIERDMYDAELQQLNAIGYNIYYLPNYPSQYDTSKPVDGSDIDKFETVFVDFDLKSKTYLSKDAFIEALGASNAPDPSSLVDSGNGIHVYWKVKDLDALSFLRLQRRLCRMLGTDEAVCKIYQLMRLPGTLNTKNEGALKPCEELMVTDKIYTCEQLDYLLPRITADDEQYCKTHHDKTYSTEALPEVSDVIPAKFGALLTNSKEVKDLWLNESDDRSKADYRLGHILFAHGFSRQDAVSVLVNCPKALDRAPRHRISYAHNIVDKIWTYEVDKTPGALSSSVASIFKRGTPLKGTRFPCYKYLDDTDHGFRLGQVIGLVAGSGVGKTSIALNMFMGFVKLNPDYDHFFVSLEQPDTEIADRWQRMCGENTTLHDKVHVMSNYAEDGSQRRLSLDEIKDYLIEFKKKSGRQIGCVVIDHIGALKRISTDGRVSIEDICHAMKGFAIETNTMLIMQSQAPREKAGIGDLELNKDAAWGTVFFESYVDYLITLWQPLKRCYTEGAPTLTSFKFCKIRHKDQQKDVIKEDERYLLYFDSETHMLRETTQEEETSFKFFNSKCANARKSDRKTEIVPYRSVRREKA